MRRLLWSRRARGELFEIADHYSQFDPLLAVDMLERIEAGPQPLLDFPFLGALTTGGSGKWRARKTPYILFYDVSDAAIEVAAVRHVRTDGPR